MSEEIDHIAFINDLARRVQQGETVTDEELAQQIKSLHALRGKALAPKPKKEAKAASPQIDLLSLFE